MPRKLFFLLFLFLCNFYFTQSKKGFQVPDSLKKKNFKLLENSFYKTFRNDHYKAELYANTFLVKAKKDKDQIKIADGYLMLHRSIKDNRSISFLDSMIIISKNLNNSDYLSDGYMYKGNHYYLKGKYSEAITNYLISRDYAKDNSETYHILNFNIGLLKLELQEYKQAIQLFLDYKLYLENNNATDRLAYQSCIYALAYTFSKLNQLNSSDYYIKLGLERKDKKKDRDFQEVKTGLLLVSGINDYKKNNHEVALKKLNHVSKLITENSFNVQNLAISNYYLGKILHRKNNKQFLNHFRRVDSIIISTKSISPELRDLYPILIDYYKKNDDKEKQLFYIEHLLVADSILHKNNLFISSEINKKYDTPKLLKEKENLISDLNFKNYTLFCAVGISIVIIIILLYSYVKNRKKIKLYKYRADLLTINKNNVVQVFETLEIEKPKEKSKINLSEDKLKLINIQLKKFEKEKRFLDKKINLEILSKELNTNRVYLSKSVNELKGQNFPQYLNELRIQYIINNLKENKNLQKFTVAAIADEAGYNNAESFTNAFKKVTGTLPSYFIKALQENDKSNQLINR